MLVEQGNKIADEAIEILNDKDKNNCSDVDNGRVVKGINFVNLVDVGDPVKQAKFYSENGADEITFRYNSYT